MENTNNVKIRTLKVTGIDQNNLLCEDAKKEAVTYKMTAAVKNIVTAYKPGHHVIAIVDGDTITGITNNGFLSVGVPNATRTEQAKKAWDEAVAAGKIAAETPLDLTTLEGCQAAKAILKSVGDEAGAKAAGYSFEEKTAFIGFFGNFKNTDKKFSCSIKVGEEWYNIAAYTDQKAKAEKAFAKKLADKDIGVKAVFWTRKQLFDKKDGSKGVEFVVYAFASLYQGKKDAPATTPAN